MTASAPAGRPQRRLAATGEAHQGVGELGAITALLSVHAPPRRDRLLGPLGQTRQERQVRFLDPHATDFFRYWDKAANDTVALSRAEAGRHPYDRRLFDLIGELSTRSDLFRRRWAAHDVQIHTTGIKLIQHPVSATSTSRTSPSRSDAISARASSPTPPNPARLDAPVEVATDPR